MDLNVWCILALVLVTVKAARFDQGPQRFFESSALSPRSEQNTGNKEVVFYLTPSQIETLEVRGAVVRYEDSDEGAQQDNENQPEESPEQEQEQDGNEAEESEQAEQPEQEQESREPQNQDLDLEEIIRILNEEQVEEEEAQTGQALNAPQVTEETSEEEREIPPRFQVQQQKKQQQKQKLQQRQQNLLAAAEKNARSKIYSAIRYQQLNSEFQRASVQLPRQQQQEARQNVEQQEEPQTEAPSLLKRFRLVPYEVEEQPEESTQEQQEQQAQQEQDEQQEQVEEQQQAEEKAAAQEKNQERLNALLTPLFSPERLAEVISQRKNRLYQNEIELQSILNELKQSSKHNDQKYAVEIERLRENLEKQNTLSKAEAIAKTAPHLIKKQIQKHRPSQSSKQGKASAPAARYPEPQRQKATRPQPVPVEVARHVPIPIVRKQNFEVKRPASAADEKRVPVTVTKMTTSK